MKKIEDKYLNTILIMVVLLVSISKPYFHLNWYVMGLLFLIVISCIGLKFQFGYLNLGKSKSMYLVLISFVILFVAIGILLIQA
jgi:hypothetical protein